MTVWSGLTPETAEKTTTFPPYIGDVNNSATMPDKSWWHVLHMPHRNQNGYAGQLLMSFGTVPRLYMRSSELTTWGALVSIATATPPQEYDLPLAADKIIAEYSSFRKWQNGRVTLFMSIKRADDGNFANLEAAFNLPVGYRPIRHEVRSINLSNSSGDPAGYAHLHIYADGTANISGIGLGVKSAFCECGFWTSF